MEFADSFFEDIEDCGSKKEEKCREKPPYSVKRCEPEWFMKASSTDQPVSDFMLLKYKADLLYHKKEFTEAVAVYIKILHVLPRTNSLVQREVTDSLTRCYVHTGEYSRALEYATKLVLPPHQSTSSWELLAECCHRLSKYEDEVLALQECAKQQRYHPTYWIKLSVAYRALCNTKLDCGMKTDSGAAEEGDGHTEQLKSILSHTVALFRPYFGRWRRREAMLQFNSTLHNSTQFSKAYVKEDCESWHSCDSSSGIESSSMAAVQSAEGEDTSTAMMTSHAISLVHQDAMTTTEYSPEKIPHDVRQNRTVSDTVTTLKNGHQTCIHGDMALPFSLLVSTNVSIKDFVEQLMKLPRGRVQELLGSFFEMSSCSCLIWARQLLLYSVRYSSSFARGAQQSQLEKVEQLLDGFHSNTSQFLLEHFTQKSVFDESTSQNMETSD